MKHKTSKHLDLLFNHFILINYGSEHNNWLSSTNKIIIPNNFRAKRGNFPYLFPFPFALCPQFPFSLIEFNRYWIGFKHNFAVRAFDSDIADASAEVAGVFDLTPHFQRSAVFDLVVC